MVEYLMLLVFGTLTGLVLTIFLGSYIGLGLTFVCGTLLVVSCHSFKFLLELFEDYENESHP